LQGPVKVLHSFSIPEEEKGKSPRTSAATQSQHLDDLVGALINKRKNPTRLVLMAYINI